MPSTKALRRLYSGHDLLEAPLYGVFDVSRYLMVPENTLRSWISGRSFPLRGGKRGRSNPVIRIADPAHGLLSFTNLTEVHILDALRQQYRVKLPQIRTAVQYLTDQFETEHPLVHHAMMTDGRDLFVTGAGETQVINVSRSGQLAIKDLVELYLQRVEWDASGLIARFYPFTRRRTMDAPRLVAMDPRYEFGKPVLAKSLTPTIAIADRFKAGESIDDLADDYGEDRLNIQEAIRCELQHQKAA